LPLGALGEDSLRRLLTRPVGRGRRDLTQRASCRVGPGSLTFGREVGQLVVVAGNTHVGGRDRIRRGDLVHVTVTNLVYALVTHSRQTYRSHPQERPPRVTARSRAGPARSTTAGSA